MRKVCLPTLLGALLLLPILGFSQATDGALVGLVSDQSGASVPNASITIENVATGVKTNVVANAAGEYRVNNLPAGAYNLTASAAGFSNNTLRNVQVTLNQTATANVTLTVGAVAS